MLVHRRVTPSIKLAVTHLYSWVERGTLSKSVLPKITTQCPQPGLEPGLLCLESSVLTMRPQHPQASHKIKSNSLKLSFKLFFFFYISSKLLQEFSASKISHQLRSYLLTREESGGLRGGSPSEEVTWTLEKWHWINSRINCHGNV